MKSDAVKPVRGTSLLRSALVLRRVHSLYLADDRDQQSRRLEELLYERLFPLPLPLRVRAAPLLHHLLLLLFRGQSLSGAGEKRAPHFLAHDRFRADLLSFGAIRERICPPDGAPCAVEPLPLQSQTGDLAQLRVFAVDLRDRYLCGQLRIFGGGTYGSSRDRGQRRAGGSVFFAHARLCMRHLCGAHGGERQNARGDAAPRHLCLHSHRRHHFALGAPRVQRAGADELDRIYRVRRVRHFGLFPLLGAHALFLAGARIYLQPSHGIPSARTDERERAPHQAAEDGGARYLQSLPHCGAACRVLRDRHRRKCRTRTITTSGN